MIPGGTDMFYKIISTEHLSDDIISMWIEAPDIAKKAGAGQFISIYSDSKSELLPRPISICDTDGENALRIVFRIVGKGTKEFAEKKAGDVLRIIGPLGNGYKDFTADYENDTEKTALIIGGGIGIPPMLLLSKTLNCRKIIVLGYKDYMFMNEDFSEYGDVLIATENGMYGTKGNVIDAVNAAGINADVIYSCGPISMLKGVKAYAKTENVPAYISLEEKMACGIGACLACVCKTNEVDSHSMVKNKRICKDGPVFDVKEVDFS